MSNVQPRSDVIAAHLSQPRFQPYEAATGSRTEALRLYRWNLELSGAIHESLGLVEVVVRNAIDRELRAWNRTRPAPAGQRPYGTNWVERPAKPLQGLLSPPARGGRPRHSTYRSAFDRAKKDSDDRDPSHPRCGAIPNHDDVVAHITFGTWVKLLPSKKEKDGRIGPSAQRGLWDHALRHSFAYKPDPLVIHYWVQRLHSLRNRVAHVEPLITTDVVSYHRTAARLLRAIDPTVSDWYASVSRIPTVYNLRP